MQTANLYPLNGDQVQFGFALDPKANAHLQRAAVLVSNRSDSLEALKDAQASAPNQLEVLVALYKFHFYRGDTEKAQDLVFQTLVKASQQGGFAHDWTRLARETADWNDPRGPGRVFLYSLKALAFIRLRQSDTDDSKSILNVLERLDPDDQIGANVIRDLLSAVKEDEDDV